MKAKILTVFAAIVLLVSGTAFVLAGSEQTDAEAPIADTETLNVTLFGSDTSYIGKVGFKWNEVAYEKYDGYVVTYYISTEKYTDTSSDMFGDDNKIESDGSPNTIGNVTFKLTGRDGIYWIDITSTTSTTETYYLYCSVKINDALTLTPIEYIIEVDSWTTGGTITGIPSETIVVTMGNNLTETDGKRIFTESYKELLISGLPAGLDITNDGYLIGMPTVTASGQSVKLIASDSTGDYIGEFTITVEEAAGYEYTITGASEHPSESKKYYAEETSEVSLTVTVETGYVAEDLNVWIIDMTLGTYTEKTVTSGTPISMPEGIGSYKVLIRDGTSVLEEFVLYIVPSAGIPGAGIIVTPSSP